MSVELRILLDSAVTYAYYGPSISVAATTVEQAEENMRKCHEVKKAIFAWLIDDRRAGAIEALQRCAANSNLGAIRQAFQAVNARSKVPLSAAHLEIAAFASWGVCACVREHQRLSKENVLLSNYNQTLERILTGGNRV